MPDTSTLIGLAAAAAALILVLQIVALVRSGSAREAARKADELARATERLERELREALAEGRRESAEAARLQREEQRSSLSQLGHDLREQVTHAATLQTKQLETFGTQLAELTRANEARLVELRQTVDDKLAGMQAAGERASLALRATLDEKLAATLKDARDGREEMGSALKRFGDALNAELVRAAEVSRDAGRELKGEIERRLETIQKDNAEKLEKMRETVDEKLQSTLEERLGKSFKLVSDQLEAVQRGLGEMRTLAAGVGDLKRVLTNVKTRGVLGEVQLANLLEQVLTPEQYDRNVATKAGSAERVEFAIRLPGREDARSVVWLPIDAKFPLEDYQRLQEAQEAGDLGLVESAAKALETRVRNEAKTIAEKYVDPPATTDFALLYLPFEGLYAEVLRRPGLFDALQRDHRVTVCGPTTLTAILNSLQMGFRTLAIEQRSSEVWKILGTIKTEFGRFGDALAKTRKKLDEAANTITAAETRSRAIERKLKGVEALPAPPGEPLLEDVIEAEVGLPPAPDAGEHD